MHSAFVPNKAVKTPGNAATAAVSCHLPGTPLLLGRLPECWVKK